MSGGGRDAVEGVRVLGVDPGTVVTGWGVVERRGGGFAHVAHGTVATARGASLPAKLAAVHHALEGCWTQWTPTVLAIEKAFVGRNVQSAFRLGEVRGVVMLLAAVAGVEVAQYSPAEV
jgi:crossover junction endodeoxyribonuclease RuvC